MSVCNVCIRNYPNRVDADLAKLRLTSVGIKSEIVTTDSVFSGAIGLFKLMVPAGHDQRALKFIEDYESGAEQQ